MKQILKFFTFLMISCSLHSTFHVVKNEADFQKLMKRYDFSVVCFVPLNKNDNKVDDIKNRLQSAALRDEFKKELKDNVGFLLVDTLAKKNSEVLDLYDISEDGICMVFNHDMIASNGWDFKSKTTSEIINFLYGHFGKNLKFLIKSRHGRPENTEKMPYYYSYGYMINNWMPYPDWPYSRWGTWPYGNNFSMDNSY